MDYFRFMRILIWLNGCIIVRIIFLVILGLKGREGIKEYRFEG